MGDVITILISVGSAVGINRLLELFINRYFNKKKDEEVIEQEKLKTNNQEFKNLKEQIDTYSDLANKLAKETSTLKMQVLNLYDYILELTSITCIKNCENRKIKSIAIDIISDLKKIEEKKDEPIIG